MRAALVLVPVAVVVGLVGCSRSSSPAAAPPAATAVATAAPASTAAVSTTTASIAPVATVASSSGSAATAGAGASRLRPPVARRTPKDAAAFVTYYFETVDHAFTTGDVGPLRRASTATNETTADFIARASAMHQQGSTPLGSTQKVGIIASRPAATPAGSAPVVEVAARYSSPAVGVVDAQHRTVSAPAVPERTVTVSVLWLAGHWRVDSVHDPAATTSSAG